jgi:hypothetical protein
MRRTRVFSPAVLMIGGMVAGVVVAGGFTDRASAQTAVPGREGSQLPRPGGTELPAPGSTVPGAPNGGVPTERIPEKIDPPSDPGRHMQGEEMPGEPGKTRPPSRSDRFLPGEASSPPRPDRDRPGAADR